MKKRIQITETSKSRPKHELFKKCPAFFSSSFLYRKRNIVCVFSKHSRRLRNSFRGMPSDFSRVTRSFSINYPVVHPRGFAESFFTALDRTVLFYSDSLWQKVTNFTLLTRDNSRICNFATACACA